MVMLAILCFIAAALAWRFKTQLGFPLSARLAIVQWVGLVLGAVFFLGSMAVIVPPGTAGVVVLFGSVRNEPLASGLHFINPFARVVEMEVRTRNYTMSSSHDEGAIRGDDSIAVITSDGLTVRLDFTVLYALELPRTPDIYRTLGEDVEVRFIRSEIRSAIRDSAANLQATELYGVKRQGFVDQVIKVLTNNFQKRGIQLQQALLRDVKLPEQITRSINDKISADQDAQKMAFVLQKEKQEAERKRIEAEGQARAQQIVSQSLTPQIIEYQRIQALRDIGAKGNLIITPMGGATPMIQVPARK